MSVITALGKLRQEVHELEASLDYRVEALSLNKPKQKKL
jgi:hypothetical protein